MKAKHRFRAQGFGSGDAGGDETPYDGAYVLIPDDTPLRPERRAVGPRVLGPETAVVVGDGEIDCDEHGRILVKFHWDDVAAHTMRVRVSQNWASKGWGGMVIPRIGMEVIVEHLRGDPDKPIVTGCVYNGANKPPYPLPEHKTRSTFKTDTHQGTGFNELRFEDANGEEEIRVHAERDMNTIVKNDRSAIVKGSGIDTVTGIRLTETLGASYTTAFGGINILSGPSALGISAMRGIGNFAGKVSQSANLLPLVNLANIRPGDVNISGDQNVTQSAGKNLLLSSGGNSMRGSGRDTNENVGRNLHVDVSGSRRAHVHRNDSLTVQGLRTERVEQFYDLAVGQALTIRVGASRIKLESDGTLEINGTNVSITATNELNLKAKKINLN
ncbi:type VI secretion system tip protein VgrG [Nereida sp. MMG024]|nr:type VI secretion system tip protein VgrG [Nereida sp. MMG025]